MVFHSLAASPSPYERDDALLSTAQLREALRFLAGVRRPAWMPQPPLAALLPDALRLLQPRATVASAAITQEGNRRAGFVAQYASRLKQLDRSARQGAPDPDPENPSAPRASRACERRERARPRAHCACAAAP